ncbi:rhodanese-like domain-containing protein [Anaerotruncus colihominis]
MGIKRPRGVSFLFAPRIAVEWRVFMSLFSRRPSFQQGLETFRKMPGAVLLDVRTPEEFAAGHVPEAVNAPLDALGRIDYQRDTPLFVYCHSGARSGRACMLLEEKGYRAVNIGGIAGYNGRLDR